MRTLGKRVGPKQSTRVRIPPHPPLLRPVLKCGRTRFVPDKAETPLRRGFRKNEIHQASTTRERPLPSTTAAPGTRCAPQGRRGPTDELQLRESPARPAADRATQRDRPRDTNGRAWFEQYFRSRGSRISCGARPVRPGAWPPSAVRNPGEPASDIAAAIAPKPTRSHSKRPRLAARCGCSREAAMLESLRCSLARRRKRRQINADWADFRGST